jgi:hypothetical protein
MRVRIWPSLSNTENSVLFARERLWRLLHSCRSHQKMIVLGCSITCRPWSRCNNWPSNGMLSYRANLSGQSGQGGQVEYISLKRHPV